MNTLGLTLPNPIEDYLKEVREAHGVEIESRCREHFVKDEASWADPEKVLHDALQEEFVARAEELDAQMGDHCTS